MTTFCIKTLSIMTFRITILSIMQSIVILSVVCVECHACWVSCMLSVIMLNVVTLTFSITTLSIMQSIVILSVDFAECHSCRVSQTSPLCWVSLCWMSLCWVSWSHWHSLVCYLWFWKNVLNRYHIQNISFSSQLTNGPYKLESYITPGWKGSRGQTL